MHKRQYLGLIFVVISLCLPALSEETDMRQRLGEWLTTMPGPFGEFTPK